MQQAILLFSNEKVIGLFVHSFTCQLAYTLEFQERHQKWLFKIHEKITL